MVAVVQREWAAKNPRATMKEPITVEDVLNSRMIAYPFRILQCCLVTDGGGALILTSAERAKDFPQQAGLYPGHRRERGNADGQPDGDLRHLARLPGRGPDGVRGGRHHPQGRRSPDDLRRLRPSAALRPRRSRLHAARGDRQVHRRRQHRARRQAAAQHQWRRPELHAFGHVRHVRAAGERAADARHRAGAGAGRQDLGLPRRRRHVRRVSGTIIFTNER